MSLYNISTQENATYYNFNSNNWNIDNSYTINYKSSNIISVEPKLSSDRFICGSSIISSSKNNKVNSYVAPQYLANLGYSFDFSLARPGYFINNFAQNRRS